MINDFKWRDAKGRTREQHHEAWIRWRKQIIDENFPERCSCRIGQDPKDAMKRRRCCEVVACGASIKKPYVMAHRESCKICSDVHAGPARAICRAGEVYDAVPIE